MVGGFSSVGSWCSFLLVVGGRTLLLASIVSATSVAPAHARTIGQVGTEWDVIAPLGFLTLAAIAVVFVMPGRRAGLTYGEIALRAFLCVSIGIIGGVGIGLLGQVVAGFDSTAAGTTALLSFVVIAGAINFLSLRGARKRLLEKSVTSVAVSLARPSEALPSSSPERPVTPFKAPDVFISYKRDERAEVAAIASKLEALKLSVWFDAELRSGTSFDAEIEKQVRAAKCVLVCWSPGAVQSDWVRAEATIGRQRNVLAAALLKSCDLPPPFNLVHTDDLRGGVSASNPDWVRLLDRIGELTGRPGIAAWERISAAPDAAALGQWMALNANDPLFERAVATLKSLTA